MDLGAFRIKWERHGEFARYRFIVGGAFSSAFDSPALDAVPKDWLRNLPGEALTAIHVGVQGAVAPAADDLRRVSEAHFDGHTLIGSAIASGGAVVLTALQIHSDGFGRILVFNEGMNGRQTGRMVQRLLEVETYRMLALLALPLARAQAPHLGELESSLKDITATLAENRTPDEAALLDGLSDLSAKLEGTISETQFRFSASRAYWALVERRIEELREVRVPGLQTFGEFMNRRLMPAMHTIRSAASRQDNLSERIGRASQLLSTRVGISNERQNQDLLDSMNRRAKVQLLLQETVEGLSVAAITYYSAGVVGYLAKAAKAFGLPVNPSLVVGVAIPPIALGFVLGLRKLKKKAHHAALPEPNQRSLPPGP